MFETDKEYKMQKTFTVKINISGGFSKPELEESFLKLIREALVSKFPISRGTIEAQIEEVKER
jgi:hypothetical protein